MQHLEEVQPAISSALAPSIAARLNKDFVMVVLVDRLVSVCRPVHTWRSRHVYAKNVLRATPIASASLSD